MDDAPLYPKFISVTFWCPDLGKEVTSTSAYVYASGCYGHSEDEYCYCDDDKYLEVTCDHGKSSKTHEVRVY